MTARQLMGRHFRWLYAHILEHGAGHPEQERRSLLVDQILRRMRNNNASNRETT